MQLHKVLFFYAFFCVYICIHAQEIIKTVSLSSVINELEKKHDLQFNYLESSAQKQVIFNPEQSLPAILTSLEKQIQLRFEAVDNKQIIIRPFKSTDLVSVCGYVSSKGFFREAIEVQPVLTIKSVTTDGKGYFELKNIPYESNIMFRNEDVFLKSVPVSSLFEATCVTVKVSLFDEQLEEITIVNYLTKGVSKQVQKVNITSTKFSVLPGITTPDVMKSLEHIPSVQSPFETVSKIYVRGGTPDQNLVLWNGIKTYSQSHFFGLISAFNPYVIEQTDFYAKGIQAKYGDRLAAVIDMKSSTVIDNQFSGGIGLNMISADIFAKIPVFKNKLSLEVSARRSYTDILQTPAYIPMAERVFQNAPINENADDQESDFYFVDYTFGLKAKPTLKDAIQLNGFFAQNDLSFTSSNTNNESNDNLITQNEGYSLQWQHQYTKKLSQQTLLNLSNYTLDYAFNNEDLFVNEQSNQAKKNFVNEYGAQTYFNLAVTTKTHLQLGYQYSMNAIRYKIEDDTDDLLIVLDEQSDKLQTHSLFSEYEINFDRQAKFQLGLRANKYSTSDKFFIEPRLYAEVSLLTNLKLNSSLSFTSQSITQIQESITSSLTLENSLWRITDDSDFNILTSEQYSLGFSYKNKGWFIDVDSYYKQTENITTLTAGFLNPIESDFNLGESKTLGAEFFLKKKFKHYSSWISYAYTDQESKFDSVNEGDYFISNLNIEHTFKWQHFYQLHDFQFSLGWLWHTGRATTNVIENKQEGKPVELIFNNINAQNLPVYHKLDFSVLYDFKFKKEHTTRYQLGVSAQNVYNRKSVLNREFRTSPGIDNNLITTEYNSLGFTPNVSLRAFW